jgi:macrolide transport system ATP-binding/permease protein
VAFLFSGGNNRMSQPFLKFQQVNFAYETAITPLFQDVSVHIPTGWAGIVGANGAGKTTFLKLATGLLNPDAGAVIAPKQTVYCPQRTDDLPEQFAALLDDASKMAMLLKGQLGVQAEWLERWPTLSHGERKRAQIAVALWLAPEVLAIDEPTNHVDAEARDILIRALRTFEGVGLLVSHDRELLDSLCNQCVFIEPPRVTVRPGGYSKGIAVATEEHQAILKQYALKKQAYKRLKGEAARRRDLGNQFQSRRSKRGIAKHDHDAKAKINAGRVSGKDAIGGKLLRQLDGRLIHAEVELEKIQVKKEYTLGIWLPGSVSKRNLLLDAAPQTLPLGGRKQLDTPQLVVRPTDRIALTGPNGTGKSTLLRWLLPQLKAPAEQVTYVPQEIDVQQCHVILEQVQTLPHEELGHLMTIVSRLGSRPHRLLESDEPSPGETRKLLLALGMTRRPHIIIMDEPTNHMDLPSIECLEEALAECPCSLLLVSHDRRFLEQLTQMEWRIGRQPESIERFVLQFV